MSDVVALGAPFEHDDRRRWHAHRPAGSEPGDGLRFDQPSSHVDALGDWSPRQTAPRQLAAPVVRQTTKHSTLADVVAFSSSPNDASPGAGFPPWRRDSLVTSEQSYFSGSSGGSRRPSSPDASSITSAGAHTLSRHSRVSSIDSVASPGSPYDDGPPATPDNAAPLLQVPPSSGKFRPIPKRKPGGTRTLTEGDRRAICLYARDNPSEKQQSMAIYFGVDRTTISKTLKNRDKWINEVPVNSRSPLAEAARLRPVGGSEEASVTSPAATVVPGPSYNPPATTAFYSPTMPAPAQFGPGTRGNLDALASAAVQFGTPPAYGAQIHPRAGNFVAQPTPYPLFASEVPSPPLNTSAPLQLSPNRRSRSDIDPPSVDVHYQYGSTVSYFSTSHQTPSIVQPQPPAFVTPPPRAYESVDAAVDVLARFLQRPLAGGDEHSRSIGLRVRELAAVVSAQQNGLGFSI